MKNFHRTIVRNSIIVLSLFSLAPATLQTQGAPCSKVSHKLNCTFCGNPAGSVVTKPTSLGRPPTAAEQANIDAALAKIAEWAGGGPNGCSDLPTVPGSSGAGLLAEQTVSDILDGLSFCIETIPQDDAAGATTSLPPGSYPLEANPGWSLETEGHLITINPGYVGKSGRAHCINLAIALMLEAYHVANSYDPDDSDREKEEGAYDFQAAYMCALASCPDVGGPPSINDVLCSIIELTRVIVAKSPLCLTFNPTCGDPPVAPWPPKAETEIPAWSDGVAVLPHYLLGKSSQMTFSPGIGGGLGHFTLQPLTKVGQAMSMGDDGLLSYIDIDFNLEAPNFQPTAFTSDSAGENVQRIALVGFDETTGDGMIVSVDLDFSSTPNFLITTKYTGGSFGVPYDLYAHPNALNKVFVLDEFGTIVLVNLVSGVATIKASILDAPTLSNCQYIQAYETIAENGNVHFVTLVATEIDSSVYRRGTTEPGAIVLCLDGNLDGVFEEFIERQ